MEPAEPTEPASAVESEIIPVPEKTGSTGVQEPRSIKLPSTAERTSKLTGGIREAGHEEIAGALSGKGYREQVAQSAYRAAAIWLIKAEEKIERLQSELTEKKVQLARTEAMLKNALLQGGLPIFINAIGGTLLGYGFSELKTSNDAWVWIVVGGISLGVGSLPVLWPMLGKEKEDRG